MLKTVLIGLGVLGFIGTVAAAPTSVSDFAWLAGCWASSGGEPGSGEQWTSPAGGTMLGTSRTVKDGRTVAHEFLELRETDAGEVVYVAHPSGQPSAEFTLKTLSAEGATFENLDHDFPQRIIYFRPERGTLRVRIEGQTDRELRGVDFRFVEIDCETGGGVPAR